MRLALCIETLVGGGAERIVCELARGLHARGHALSVYCLKTPGAPAAALHQAGIHVRTPARPRHLAAAAWEVACWLRRDRIELVHAHSSAAVLACLPGARLLGVPLVQTRHGCLLGQPSRYRRLAEAAAPLLDAVVIVADSLRGSMQPRRLAQTAVHIPNGLDQPQASRADARRALAAAFGCDLPGPLLLSIGALCPEKDIRGLLRAFALVRRAHPSARLVCVGPERQPAYAAAVRAEIERLDLAAAVHLVGPVADAWRLTPAADVFVLSSATEAMPNVVVEAMSQAVPIVATTVGDVGRLDAPSSPYLLRDRETGLLAPPGDPAALAAAILETLRDPAAAATRARAARRDYLRHWTVAPMIHRHEQLYATLLRRRGRTPASRPSVIMLGPAPPLIGGMVTSIGLLMNSPLREPFALTRRGVTTGAVTNEEFGCGTVPPRVGPVRTALRHAGALWRLARDIVTHRAALLHIHTCSYFSFYRNLLDLLVAKLLGVKVVLHIRGCRFEDFLRDASPTARRVIRLGLEAADAVIVLSQSWKTIIAPRAGRARLHVVYNAFDPQVAAAPRSARIAETGRCRFLFLAALTEAKGLGDLLEAARLAVAQGADFELLVAGPAPAERHAEWVARAQRLGLAGRVRFVGAVSGPAKAELLGSADCLVHPSHNEGLPNSVLEGAAAGLPVIATTVGAVSEVFAGLDLRDDAGRPIPLPLVPAKAPARFAAEMLRLATDESLRQRLAHAMSAHVRENFNINRTAAGVAAVYRAVLGRRAPQSATSGAARTVEQPHVPADTTDAATVNAPRAPAACGATA